MIKLRPYSVQDQEAVVTLWWDSWHSIRRGLIHPQKFVDWRTRWADQIEPVQAIVVAEDEDIVVGFAAADVTARELTQIFVAPNHKRQGIGRELFIWAQQLMPEGFSLHTLSENLASRRFYESLGLVAGSSRISPVNGMETIEYSWMPSHDDEAVADDGVH